MEVAGLFLRNARNPFTFSFDYVIIFAEIGRNLPNKLFRKEEIP